MAEGGSAASSSNPPALVSSHQVHSPSGGGHVRGYSYDHRTLSAEVPLDVRLEKMRLAEALVARDHAVHCMENICSSLRRKETLIARLQQEKAELETKLATHAPTTGDGEPPSYMKEIERLYTLNKDLQAEIDALKCRQEESVATKENHFKLPPVEEQIECPIDLLSPISKQGVLTATEDAEKPETLIQARYAILAELPLSPDMPDGMLVPIIIPSPFTIHDFLGSTVGALKAQLTNYRVFQESTTLWCPDREEHGYYLTPFYKCSTNPRVHMAHRWTTVDLIARMGRPTECFYNKDDKWYYAGVYKSFRLPDITPQEWVQLPTETTQTLIKETIAARKNTSPQNVYETSQLYACGALKAACIGLQCIGFDEKLYRALLSHAEACKTNGRWRGPSGGLGTGAAWNANANVDFGQPPTNVECENSAYT